MLTLCHGTWHGLKFDGGRMWLMSYLTTIGIYARTLLIRATYELVQISYAATLLRIVCKRSGKYCLAGALVIRYSCQSSGGR